MKTVGIVTDSHSGMLISEANQLGIKVIPMPFFVDGECYYEEVSITIDEFFEQLSLGKQVSTSQPSPESVMNGWKEALEEYEKIVYIPLSSGLSGACNTAKMLACEEEFEGKVFVVDNGRIATPLHRSLLDALELVKEGYSAEEIKDILEKCGGEMSIYIAVESLELLKKGGRISATSAALGTMLNIKPVLRLGTGVLDTYRKCRGMKKAKKEMIDALKYDLETTFAKYDKNDMYLMAATSADEETTKEWIAEIEEAFPGTTVMCDRLTLGISCHVGAGALGIGCSFRPKK